MITGIGLITPLGSGRELTWTALRSGKSGISEVEAGGRQWCCGVVNNSAGTTDGKKDRSIEFVLSAAKEALEDAALAVESLATRRAAVVVGCSKGGITSLAQRHERFRETHDLGVLSDFLDNFVPSAPATALARQYKVAGPTITISTACAAGSHSIIEAANLIKEGRADVALTGATEASLHPLIFSSYDNMGVLAKRNGDCQSCCRPFDSKRTGFAPAEGSAVFLLEEAECAQSRGAIPYAFVTAGGRGGDAFHITNLSEDGSGIARIISDTLSRASLYPEDIDYVNAHGTGTIRNDVVETRALKLAFGEHARRMPVSSTKGATGHLLGAAGSVEAAICALAIRDGCVPPTLHLTDPDPECDLDYVPGKERAVEIRRAMTLSFGFGGQIGVLVLSRGGNH